MVLMRGVTLVRRGVLDYLRNKVPQMHALALAQWGLDGEALPLPETYEAYEPTGISHGHGPLVAVGVTRGSRFKRVDLTGFAEEQYQALYNIRVYLWCFTPNDEEWDQEGANPVVEEATADSRQRTLRVRDDLAGIIRSSLLDTMSLGQPDAFLMNESTLIEEYSDGTPTTSASRRWVAGVVFAFDLEVDESLYREPANDPEEPNTVIIETAHLDRT